MRLQFGEHVEAREPRHLDVEEHEIRPLLADGGQGFTPVAALADDLDVRRHAQSQLEASPRQRLVVDQQRTKFSLSLSVHAGVTCSGKPSSIRSPGLLSMVAKR